MTISLFLLYGRITGRKYRESANWNLSGTVMLEAFLLKGFTDEDLHSIIKIQKAASCFLFSIVWIQLFSKEFFFVVLFSIGCFNFCCFKFSVVLF